MPTCPHTHIPTYSTHLLYPPTLPPYSTHLPQAAEQGDQIFANMAGFFCEADGSKGEKLPDVAGGDAVEIPLVEGRFMFGAPPPPQLGPPS